MNTNIRFAACSEFRHDGEATWFQTFPAYGRYPVGGLIEDAAEDAEFVFDEASAKDIIDAFNAEKAERADWPGVLVDREHFSRDRDKCSDAMAWATDIRQDEDGSIWTKWEFTRAGRELWESKTLVNRSPCFACRAEGKDYRPLRLISIGMTNTPHFKELSNLAAARAAEVNNTPKENPGMDKLKELLGLNADASEEDVLASARALQERASAAEAETAQAREACKAAETQLRALECDAFVSEHKDQIADEAACREAFMANPDMARKLVAACSKAPEAPKQTVLAPAKAVPEKKDGAQFASAREQMNTLPPSERGKFYREHKAEIDNEQ